MTTPEASQTPNEERMSVSDALTLVSVREQASRYLEALYGKDIWYRAPETLDNLLYRWIWGIATNVPQVAETAISQIEEMIAQDRKDRQERMTQDQERM